MKIHLSYKHDIVTSHVWAGQTSLRPAPSHTYGWFYSGAFHMHLWSDGFLTLISHSDTPAKTLKPRATLTLVMALGAALRSKAIVKQPVAPLQIAI